MNILRIAAFSNNGSGGNPAGVHIAETHPSAAEMQKVAAEVGYSETAFAHPIEAGWRVRYFSPESEVPFCGHATIALGAALAHQSGAGTFPLVLNEATISVEGSVEDGHFLAALQSPPTTSEAIATTDELIQLVLKLFSYTEDDLDTNIPPALANAGANHLIITLNSREKLSTMHYDLEEGRHLMNIAGLVTIMFVYPETEQRFHTRNAFASGGVIEDPATGAATAAFAGYLRDINWPHGGSIEIIQGEDMGAKSLISADITPELGSSIRVSGAAHFIQ